MGDIRVQIVTELKRAELSELCEAANDAIEGGGGFGWLKPPHRNVMESYWKGVLLVPDRTLFLGWLDDTVAGSAQLIRPNKNNEAQGHTAQIATSFVAPWARGHGLARQLTLALEDHARAMGVLVLNLDVRETQEAAIQLYRSLGYHEIGRHPKYAKVEGRYVAGLYYWKALDVETPNRMSAP